MYINDILTENIHYIFNPLILYNADWRWDTSKFSSLPKDKLIIVNCSSENWGLGPFIKSLYNELEKHNLNFLVLSHNPDDHLFYPNLLFYPYWYYDSIKNFKWITNSIEKSYNLSCLNASPRPHRIYNYFLLTQKKYNNVLVTIHSHNDVITKKDDDYLLDENLKSQWQQLSPNLTPRSVTASTSDMNSYNHPAYLDSYINLITETTISSRLFITEKTWKPIAAGQLFLLIGSPNTIKFLRDQGVDTFDDIIDHDYYDTEPDFEVRIKKIYEVLDQLMISNLKQIYIDTKTRRELNQKNFFTGNFDSQYFKQIKKCINMLK